MAKFQNGCSGNPAGRPKGSRDRRTALRELLAPHAGHLISKAVELANSGDTPALRLCLERILPPNAGQRRGRGAGRGDRIPC
jgi:hypothetical protein